MITLVTGSPGAGKTLWMVKHLVEDLVPSGRPIYTNIAGLDIPDADNVKECSVDTPYNWFEYEDGAIFIFDEVQKQYPARHSTSRMPKHIEEFQTHRHKGMDFFFVTQGPKLIDRALHDLTERHVHLFRAFGMSRSKVSEYGAVNDTPQPPQTYSSAVKRTFRFPPQYYSYYRSASQHTVQTKLPWHFIIPALVMAIVTVLLFVWVVQLVRSGFNRQADVVETAPDPEKSLAPCGFAIIGVTPSEYIVRTLTGVFSVEKSLVKQTPQGYTVKQDGFTCRI